MKTISAIIKCLVAGIPAINSLPTQARLREVFNRGNVNSNIRGISFISSSRGFVSLTNLNGLTE